ncbi:MAG: SIR2 family protein, partial [Myxococcota bacterium]
MPRNSVSIPESLKSALGNGQCILFLGAGASMGAKTPNGQGMYSSDGLKEKIATKFLNNSSIDADLSGIADYAIDSAGLSVVTNFIRELFEPFEPTKGHRLVPRFRWRAIATTNYDRLIEKAYSLEQSRLQNLVVNVKNSQPVETMLKDTDNAVVYLKLHGCLDYPHDSDIPLVLNHESYERHSLN